MTLRIAFRASSRRPFLRARWLPLVVMALGGCADALPTGTSRSVEGLANGCYRLAAEVSGEARSLRVSSDGASYAFRDVSRSHAARFVARASDLGTYVLRDADGGYVLGSDSAIPRATQLDSDVLLNDDSFVSPAEWMTSAVPDLPGRFVLQNRATGGYLAERGTVADRARALPVVFAEAEGCASFPELTVDATGTVGKTRWDDGDVYGVADTHSHLFTNFGFGAGGTFHGAPFHRLGVEHALPSCEPFHGWEGRRDLVGFFYSGRPLDLTQASVALLLGEVQEFNHDVEGYPDFTFWPNAVHDDTHQAQYYRWIERAYLGGLRLLVQHATSNQVLCELATGSHAQTARISCNEMVSAERTLDEVYALERYVDAQSGGAGRGWFRVVRSPAEARQVIGDGKLAVVLGIETSNLFDCFKTPPAGQTRCDEARVRERLDHFYGRGVRALFPVHKFDNGFSAGDGSRGFLEFGNFVNGGHYSNYVTDCPGSAAVYDHGAVVYGDLNQPRTDYFAPPDADLSRFAESPVATMIPYISFINSPSLPGEHCQNAGLTPLGETLILEMMKRGMILEIDHLPQRGYERAIDMLLANDYPAACTHGSNAGGRIYDLGGISSTGLPRCTDPTQPTASAAWYRAQIDEIRLHGGYPAKGFAFDLNGFAGAHGPRFGAQSGCGADETNPITYPFSSYAGDVTFDEPDLGNRRVDFNTEGMVHIGLLPELIEDARHMGFDDADLEPLFRSAEGYLRMWERAEARGLVLATTLP